MFTGILILISIVLGAGAQLVLRNPSAPHSLKSVAGWMWRRLVVIYSAIGLILLITAIFVVLHMSDAPAK